VITGGKRRRGAKNDRIDAIQAARTALSSEHQASPRSRGLREALRQVMATRRAVLVSRTKAINELKSLIVVAPEYLRAPLRGCSLLVQLRRIEDFISPPEAGVEHRITVFTMRSIAARIRFLFAQTAELDPQLLALVKQHPAGPVLLAEPGVGPVSAAQLLISWSHPGQVRRRSSLRRTGRGSTTGSQQRPTNPTPPWPRRRPRPQPRTALHRDHQPPLPPGVTAVRDQAHRAGQNPPRRPPFPQTCTRPQALSPHRIGNTHPSQFDTAGTDSRRLTNIGASNGLIRDYIPKGEDIPSHQTYLDAIAAELNERPRQVLGFITPREAFERLLADDLASTG